MLQLQTLDFAAASDHFVACAHPLSVNCSLSPVSSLQSFEIKETAACVASASSALGHAWARLLPAAVPSRGRCFCWCCCAAQRHTIPDAVHASAPATKSWAGGVHCTSFQCSEPGCMHHASAQLHWTCGAGVTAYEATQARTAAHLLTTCQRENHEHMAFGSSRWLLHGQLPLLMIVSGAVPTRPHVLALAGICPVCPAGRPLAGKTVQHVLIAAF